VFVVPAHHCKVGIEQSPRFGRDRGEHFFRRRGACHERRHPPDRGLFIVEPRERAPLPRVKARVGDTGLMRQRL
jgi:hypothetical protein